MPWIVFLLPTTLILFGVPLILRIVPPNHIYGFRMSKTLSDEGVWYAANYVAGWDLVLAGVAQFVVLSAYPIIPGLRDLQPRQLIMATQMPILLAAIAHSFWRVWRMESRDSVKR